MGWMEIGTALLLGAMLVFLVPRLPAILRATPKASGKQWLTALVPLVLIGAFVFLLMKLV